MQPKLQQGFDAIERQRTNLQSTVLALSEPQLQWTPNPADVWSIQQIVEHLVLGDETVGRGSETPQSEALLFRVLPRAWRRALVLRAFNRDKVLPLPSPAVDPTGKVPLPELLTRWETLRDEMRRTLEALQDDKPRYSHPVLGPLTAAQLLQLGETHTAYHLRQIETLRRNPSFPTR